MIAFGNGKPLKSFKPETDMSRLAFSKWTLISEQTVLCSTGDCEQGNLLGGCREKSRQDIIQTVLRTQITDKGRFSMNTL